MSKAFFRIFIQFQNPKTFSYIGAPKSLECPHCHHSWWFDPVSYNDVLSVRCKKCEKVSKLDELFDTVYVTI